MNRSNAVALTWNLTDFATGPLSQFALSEGKIYSEKDRQAIIQAIHGLKGRHTSDISSCDNLIKYITEADMDVK